MENNTIAKITISNEQSYDLVDDVIYYRSGMSVDFAIRWRWYFEYLAARVKVMHPRCKVGLVITHSDGILLGKEWHEHRRSTMIKTVNRKLSELENTSIQDDLFGFTSQDIQSKIAELRDKLKHLMDDTYPIPEMPEYINKIKQYIK